MVEWMVVVDHMNEQRGTIPELHALKMLKMLEVMMIFLLDCFVVYQLMIEFQ